MTLLFAIAAAAAWAVGAMLAAVETAVMLLPPGRVHRLVEADRRGAPQLERLSQRAHRVRGASALAAALVFGTGVALGFEVGGRIGAEPSVTWEVVAALAATAAGFALCQALPRTLAAANPERIGLDAAPVAVPAVAVLYPVARALGAPFRWMVRVAAGEAPLSAWATEEEARPEGDEDSAREEAEEAILEAVSDFAEKVAREVMVPRTDMKALGDYATAGDAVQMIEKTGFTRLPVYHETIDDIRGVLYAKDLLVALASGRAAQPVMELVRAPYFVPETKPVEELLVEMRAKTHIAIVADEYGGTSGLVTLEDLLEEIVGEISDEYDSEEPLLVDLGDGRFRVDARLPVDELNEVFGTDIDTETDSVGGLFTEVAGRIPATGESVEVEGLRLTVGDLKGTRICHLTVEPAGSTDDEREADA